MSIVFARPISENKIAASLFAVRVGMAFVFFWAGNGKVSDPAGFGMMLQNMVGMEANMSTTMAMLIGIGELISAAFILTGFLTRPAAIFQGVILVGAMSMFGFDFTQGPGVWKDPALLGIVVSLAIFGSGKFGIDQLIAKKLKPSDSVFEK